MDTGRTSVEVYTDLIHNYEKYAENSTVQYSPIEPTQTAVQ